MENALTPVVRAPSPGRGMLLWIAVTVPSLAAMVWMMGPLPDIAALLVRPEFLLVQGLAVGTAVLAAYGALCAGRPDQPGWKTVLPFAAALLWAAALGRQCFVLAIGGQGSALVVQPDLICVPAIAASALPSALAILWVLRRGTSFRRVRACLCAALAAAAAAQAALRLYHPDGTFATMLVWQIGSVGLWTLVGAALTRLSLPRPQPMRAS
ncbi:MAG: DUF1109 family protein [Rhodospirillales bacterium]|nr:DUF1109 family protein [Rhodospirillales bacterium]